MEHLEEKIAHLMRQVDELSDVVARHEAEIGRLSARVRLLLEREATREADDEGGQVYMADQRPPHW